MGNLSALALGYNYEQVSYRNEAKKREEVFIRFPAAVITVFLELSCSHMNSCLKGSEGDETDLKGMKLRQVMDGLWGYNAALSCLAVGQLGRNVFEPSPCNGAV